MVSATPQFESFVSSSSLGSVDANTIGSIYSGLSNTVASAINSSPYSLGSTIGAALNTVTPAPALGPAIGTDPSSTMAGYYLTAQGVQSLSYPPDTPPYYLTLAVGKYNRQSWTEVGNLDMQAMIVLPIPEGIVDIHSVAWTGEEIGAIPGSIILGNGLTSTAGGVTKAASLYAAETGGPALSGIADSMEFRYGVAINNYISMMLKGPEYKTHTFGWTFSPENEKESQTLAAIYRLVNAAQAPSLGDMGVTGSAFFRYPAIFKLAFQHDGDSNPASLSQMLYQFKPAVLTRSIWNFAPEGLPSFFSGSHAPQAVKVILELTEIEYWLSQDYIDLATSVNPFQS